MSRAPLFLAHSLQHPANAERLLAIAIDLHRHLIGSTTHPLGTHFNSWLYILNRAIKDLDWLSIGHLLSHDLHGSVKDALSNAFLAVKHEAINELAG